MELIHAMVAGYDGISVFAGVGERSREGHEMLLDMRGSGVLDRTVLVYGQMNEPPAPLARADERADHCRMVPRRSAPQCPAADGQRVPLRSGGRGSLGLLGRLPSRVGYQPTLASEVAALEERIASVGGASVTAIQAVYVPADDFTDPAVTTIAAHADLDGGSLARHGRRRIYPAVDPIASSSVLLDPLVVGEEHATTALEVRRAIEHYRELEDVIALLGMEELGAEDRRIVGRARRLQRFLTQPFTVTEGLTGTPGRSVKLADTIAGCRAILDGECDDWAEASLYMIGTLDEAGPRKPPQRRPLHEAPLHLTIATPTQMLVDCDDVVALRAEDETGSFGILPGHADSHRPAGVGGALAVERRQRKGLRFARGRPLRARRSGGDCRARRRSGGALADLAGDVLHAQEGETDADRRARAEQTRLHARAVRQMVHYLMPDGGSSGGNWS
jgi:hypothetical protein